jgi:pimeloyl-ACP methyl ester carboxylesterase
MKLLKDAGRGDCLALVCALGCDEELFTHQVAILSRRRRVMVFQSEGEESLAIAASELLAMLGSLGLRQVDLGGLSLGGYVAQEALARAPSALRRLILMDTRAEADSPEARAARLDQIRRLGEGHFESVLAELLPRLLSAQSLQDHGEAVARMMRRVGPALLAAQLTMLLGRRDTREVLGLHQGPALVLCGAADALTPVAGHRDLAARLPKARLVVIPGNCGHLSSLEAPEAVTAALESFLGD